MACQGPVGFRMGQKINRTPIRDNRAVETHWVPLGHLGFQWVYIESLFEGPEEARRIA